MAKKSQTKAFEKKIRVRRLNGSDFAQVVALQKQCFPGMKPWSREQFDSQLLTFPEGQRCVTVDGKLAASSASLVVHLAMYSE